MNLIGGDTEYGFGSLIVLVDGDWCEECQKIECDTCHKMTTCYEITDAGNILCDRCYDWCDGCDSLIDGEPQSVLTDNGMMTFHADCHPAVCEYEKAGGSDASPVGAKPT
jgi:hypothetical protein